MLVCLDTPVLIFTQQTEPFDGHEEAWRAAQKYERWIRESPAEVLLPTPVISEFLTGDPGDKDGIVSAFRNFAEVADFDLRAAELTGELRNSYSEENELRSGVDRDALTIDMMISAIAIVNRASHIVTHNVSDFEEITAEFEEVEVRSIEPGPPGQGELELTE